MTKRTFLFDFQYCESKGGAVVELNSKRESDVLWENRKWLFEGYNIWIGLTKVNEEYKWDSGEGVSWTNWFPGYPDDDDCTYANPYYDFTWTDWSCSNHFYVLCEA